MPFHDVCGRKSLVNVVKVMSGKGNLLQIILALRSTSGLASLLNSWQ